MTPPTPAIVAQNAVRRLPRIALLLLCLAYVVPGFIGREPWKNADMTAFGYMAELETVRNALRAWALTQGAELTGLPFEVYKRGIDQSFTANGQYDVYWMLKK